MEEAKSARIVPASASFGLVAPISSRFFRMAPSPSRTCTTTGPEVVKARALFVLGVETFGLLLGQVHHFGRNDFQVGFFKTAVDFADNVLGDRVGLDDRERALVCHDVSPVWLG